jgi:type 1 glutamine amidotransferase
MSSTQVPLRVLILSKTAGYRHSSIPASITAIKRLGDETGKFTVTRDTEDASVISTVSLSVYDVVLFLQTTGEFLDNDQVAALKSYVNAGGAFVGVHGAAAAMESEPWYTELIGTGFDGHPEPQSGIVKLEQRGGGTAITAGLPETWSWFDEWYNFSTNPRDKVNVILSIEEAEYEGGKMGGDHPLAWYREYDGGRSFYTSLGHFEEAYEENTFMTHLLNGILWAANRI